MCLTFVLSSPLVRDAHALPPQLKDGANWTLMVKAHSPKTGKLSGNNNRRIKKNTFLFLLFYFLADLGEARGCSTNTFVIH